MNSKLSEKITGKLVPLSESLGDLPKVLLYLMQNKYLSSNDKELIESQKTSLERSSAMFIYLTKRTDVTEEILIQIFTDTTNQHLVNILNDGMNSKSPNSSESSNEHRYEDNQNDDVAPTGTLEFSNKSTRNFDNDSSFSTSNKFINFQCQEATPPTNLEIENISEEILETLGTKLGDFPTSRQLALAIVKANKPNIQCYFKATSRDLFHDILSIDSSEISTIIVDLVKKAISIQPSGEVALTIWELLSYIRPSDVEFDLLAKCTPTNDEEIKGAVELLVQYGLATKRTKTKTVQKSVNLSVWKWYFTWKRTLTPKTFIEHYEIEVGCIDMDPILIKSGGFQFQSNLSLLERISEHSSDFDYDVKNYQENVLKLRCQPQSEGELKNLYMDKRFDEALKLAKNLEKNSKSAVSSYYYALCLYHKGETEEALEILKNLLRECENNQEDLSSSYQENTANPDWLTIAFSIFKIHFRLGNQKISNKLFQKICANIEEHSENISELIDLLLNANPSGPISINCKSIHYTVALESVKELQLTRCSICANPFHSLVDITDLKLDHLSIHRDNEEVGKFDITIYLGDNLKSLEIICEGNRGTKLAVSENKISKIQNLHLEYCYVVSDSSDRKRSKKGNRPKTIILKNVQFKTQSLIRKDYDICPNLVSDKCNVKSLHLECSDSTFATLLTVATDFLTNVDNICLINCNLDIGEHFLQPKELELRDVCFHDQKVEINEFIDFTNVSKLVLQGDQGTLSLNLAKAKFPQKVKYVSLADVKITGWEQIQELRIDTLVVRKIPLQKSVMKVIELEIYAQSVDLSLIPTSVERLTVKGLTNFPQWKPIQRHAISFRSLKTLILEKFGYPEGIQTPTLNFIDLGSQSHNKSPLNVELLPRTLETIKMGKHNILKDKRLSLATLIFTESSFDGLKDILEVISPKKLILSKCFQPQQIDVFFKKVDSSNVPPIILSVKHNDDFREYNIHRNIVPPPSS